MIYDKTFTVPNFNNRHILDKTSNFIARCVFSSIKDGEIRLYFRDKYWECLDIDKNKSKDDYDIHKSRKKNFFLATNNCTPIGELNIKLKNSEYFDLINIQFICNPSYNEYNLEGMISFRTPNILLLTCYVTTSTIHFSNTSQRHQLYLKLARIIRHELQHSYQSFFLTDDELSVELEKIDTNNLGTTIYNFPKFEKYYMTKKKELDAFLHAYKYMAKKTNQTWEDFMAIRLEERNKNTSLLFSNNDLNNIKTDVDKIYDEIKNHLINFNRQYGHMSTCFYK